jgi:hypothetical protein
MAVKKPAKKPKKKPAKKPPPYPFVLEELSAAHPYTKPMFGCLGVYVGEAIVLILRKKEKDPENDGIWVATSADRHEALRPDLPSMRPIPLFGPGETDWQWLPESDLRFEEDALRACALVRKYDSRIGRIPKRKKPKKKKA